MSYFIRHQSNNCAKIFLMLQVFLMLNLQNALAHITTHVSDTPVLRSCWELKLAGYSRDGEYTIDPDGPGKGEDAFTIYCDMTTGTAIVKHDRLNRALVPRGFEDKGNYRAPVNYFGANVKQLAALADVSGNCSQFMRIECKHVLMWWKGEAWTWWVSRDGIQMNNWGSPTGTQGCLCSLDKSCDADQNRCSCDVNDGTWRHDDGLLTDKRALPVKEMRFGDSQGSDEMALFKLGEFRCTGLDRPLYSSCEDVVKARYYKGTYLLNLTVNSEETGAEGNMLKIVECDEKDEPSGDPPPMYSCTDLRQAGYRTDGKYQIDPDGPQVGVRPFSVQCYLSSDLTPPIMKSCADLRLAGYSISKDYLIDPDGSDTGLEPFLVYCDLTTGTSIVHHDQRPLTEVPFGYAIEGEYRVPIHYKLQLEQMIALIDSSKTCRQYISLDCHHVLIWHNEDLISWWVSRDGEKMTNWASPTGTMGCGCSVHHSCDKEQPRCNCDLNDYIWRRDDGYLTDKSTLPVTELRLSDTNHLQEQVFYTLGDLECSGLASNIKASSTAEGKPLTPKDNRPSSNPSDNPASSTGVSSTLEDKNSSCPYKSAYTGLVVGIILILIVVVVLLIILVLHWRSYRHITRGGYRSGVI